MAWNVLFVFVSSMLVLGSMEGYNQPFRASYVWGYFTPPILHREPPYYRQTPMEAMVDLTNSLGVAILQDNAFSRGNFAFSPYGVASVLVVLYEGARGESARQIHRAVGFPSDKDMIRIGFRDIHRHLRSYFSHEGYLSGISLNKQASSLNPEYKKMLRFYGYDIDLNPLDDEDDDGTGLGKPTSLPPTAAGTKKTTVLTTSSTTGSPEVTVSTQSGDRTTQKVSDVEKNNVTSVTTVTTTVDSTTSATNENVTASITTGGITATSTTEVATELEATTTTESPMVTTTMAATSESPIVATTETSTIESTSATSTTESTTAASTTESTTAASTTESTTAASTTESTTAASTTESTTTTSTTESTAAASTTESNIATSTTESTTATSTTESTAEPTTASTTIRSTTVATSADIMSGNTEATTTVENTITATTVLNATATTSTENMAENTTEEINTTTATQTDSAVSETITSQQDPITTETIKATTTTPAETVTGKPTTTTTEFQSTESTTETQEVTTGTASENTKEAGVTESNSEQQEMLSMTKIDLKVDSVTETPTDSKTTIRKLEMVEMNKIDESTRLNIDNGMLIPQSSDFVTTTETGRNSEPIAMQILDSGSVGSPTDSYPPESTSLMNGLQPGGRNIIRVSGKKRMSREQNEIPIWLIEKKNSRKMRTVTDYLKTPRSPDLSLQLQNGMYDTHVSRNIDLYRSLPRYLFLVDGSVDTPVPMMTYTNVFPYAYIPKLHAKALEFPLDDTRYKLVILLPVERRGLRQLIYDLLDYPLSNALGAMKPARVKAVVPTFMVEGFVILTSSLQKLGIWDVFDPRKANLSGMSMDPELYVRNVEQSVTVVIRNYVEILDIQTRTMAARYMEHEFQATHPFLYFVLDTSTNVALMAGQILDPLNSRIY